MNSSSNSESNQQKGRSSFTFTPTVHPIVWEGREKEEPLTIRLTRELFPTPIKMIKFESESLTQFESESLTHIMKLREIMKLIMWERPPQF